MLNLISLDYPVQTEILRIFTFLTNLTDIQPNKNLPTPTNTLSTNNIQQMK